MKRGIVFFLLGIFLVVPSFSMEETPIFKKAKLVVQEGEKSKEKKVSLVFREDEIVVRHRKDTDVIYAKVPYSSVTSIIYERSTHPRAKSAIFISPFFLLSKSKKHWLTITYKEGDESRFVLLKLDKKEYQRVLALMGTRTEKEVERVIE